MCNHPSIIKILSSFQTTNKLFYVLEYAPNKDLDYLLRKFGILPEALAKFYAAEILNTLEYLHKKKSISHNDLKPGNIMLDDHYHLKFVYINIFIIYRLIFQLLRLMGRNMILNQRNLLIRN